LASSSPGLDTSPEATELALDSYLIGGLVLAGALVAAYIALRAWRRRQWPDIGDVVLIVVTTTAVTAGVRLVVVAISSDSLGPFRSEDRVFIPLAGVTLILVSVREIYEVFRDRALDS
jgi:hypothetical protein